MTVIYRTFILNTLHHNKHAAKRYILSELNNERAKNRPTNTLERRSMPERHAQSWKTDTAVTHRFWLKQTAGVRPLPLIPHISCNFYKPLTPVTISCIFYKPLTPVTSSVTIL